MDIDIFSLLRQFDKKEQKRVSKYLRAVIYASIALNTIYCFLLLIYPSSNASKLLITNLGLFFVYGSSLLLLRRDQVKKAVMLTLTGGWFCLSLMPFIWQGATSAAILGFLLIVLLAGLLVNSRWAYFFTGLSLVYAVIFLLLRSSGQLSQSSLEVTPLHTWGVFIIAFLVFVQIYELSAKRLNLALEESIQNIKALNEKNDLLIATKKALQDNLAELSRSEAALRLSKKHLQTVVQSAPVILWTGDLDGRMNFLEGSPLSSVNIQANQFHGETIFEVLGQRIENLEAKIADVMRGETVVSVDYLKGRIFENHFSPLFEKGAVSGIIGIAIDITERVQAQDALIHLQKTESLGVLAGGIAHDFNNLLVGILGQASVAIYKMEDDHPAKVHIDKAVFAAKRAGGLTRQLLAYSGQGQFKIEDLDLNLLVQDNVSLFKTAASRNALLEVILDDEPLIVQGDMMQLQQIIMNLIINGIESIAHETGKIVIKTRRVVVDQDFQEKYCAEDLLPVGRYAVFEVSDNGTGMTAEVIKKIFDPFFTTKKTGKGLGLAAAHGIVRSHKGSLLVSSKPNEGTTFQVLLPLISSPVFDQQEEKVDPLNLDSYLSTILQIDEDPSVCEVLTDILATQDIEVISALTESDGLEIFQREHTTIDLIILDMIKPNKSFDLIIEKVKAINCQIPIIVSSGFGGNDGINGFDMNKVQGFIPKPYSADSLVSQLVKTLKG